METTLYNYANCIVWRACVGVARCSFNQYITVSLYVIERRILKLWILALVFIVDKLKMSNTKYTHGASVLLMRTKTDWSQPFIIHTFCYIRLMQEFNSILERVFGGTFVPKQDECITSVFCNSVAFYREHRIHKERRWCGRLQNTKIVFEEDT